MSRAMKQTMLRAEVLETREVPASVGVIKQAVLDFDGDFVTAGQFSEGGWSLPSQTVSSFRGMFTAGAPAFMDANKNGVINGADADLVISKIHVKVMQDYDPYHVQVFLGDQDTHQAKLTDADKGDVMILVNGGNGAFTGHDSFGVAPRVDIGNTHDEMAFVFGGTIKNASSSLDDFVNRVARTVSHEMAHTFGLDHLSTATGTDAQTHHLMEVDNRDFSRDFGFQDTAFNTDSGVQNSHQILSQENVLGKSRDPWVAVLKPGQLTVSGGIGNDTIKVERLPVLQPPIFLDAMSRLSDLTINLIARWRVTINGASTIVDLNASGFNTLNNLDTGIGRVNVLGQGGSDTLTVDSSMTAPAFVDGGSGNDVIQGGSGDDNLVGGTGKDILRGGAGDDRLDGSNDNTRDVLQGQTGSDTFVQHKIIFFFDEDTLLDKGPADTEIVI
jgi:Ca2+-binding RTX toxin-like protein